jgi:hypothetical protein
MINRRSFEPWAAGLSADDFACAIAATGVLQAAGWKSVSQAVRLTIEVVVGRLIEISKERSALALEWCAWVPPRGDRNADQPASIFADAWRKFAASFGYPLRMQIGSWDTSDALWIAEQLSRPAVGAHTVVFAQHRDVPARRWHWPLRVGLLRDERSKALWREIDRQGDTHTWAREILTLVDVEQLLECDLLLLPFGPRSATARILDAEPGVMATCVVAAGPLDTASDIARAVDVISAETKAQAVVVVDLGVRAMADWFVDRLIREIAHDQEFDVALVKSFGKPDHPFYFVSADPQWLDQARLAHLASTLRTSMARPEVAEKKVVIRGDLASRLQGGNEGAQALFEIGAMANDFLGETHDATTFSRLTHAVGSVLKQNPPARPQRFLQAQVYAPSSDALTVFRPDTVHRVDVRIGPTEASWTSSSTFFPEDDLPPSEKGHRLTVVFTEPDLAPQPQVSHVHLPPQGASSTCGFYLSTTPTTTNVEARVAVLYRNRVLQTSSLTGAVTNDSEVAENGRIAFAPEVVVNAGMTDLDREKPYDAALILNHTASGSPRLLKIVDDHAELVSTGTLQPLVQKIEDKLSQCDWGAKDFRNLAAPGTLDLLRYLAARGSLLYNGVVATQFIDRRLAAATSLQLIAAKPGARLPVEYFYDKPFPNGDAKLCKKAQKALADGKCGGCSSDGDPGRYVCPLGFWGLNRVLEWHIYRQEATRQLQGHDFALQQEKVARRSELPKLDRALVAASDRAKTEVKTAVADLIGALKNSKIKAAEVRSWADWRAAVARQAPALLILITHTDVDATFNIPKIEIGKEQWLNVGQVDRSIVRGNGASPVVLILGCETARQDVTFEDLISNFMRPGEAAIVVASSTSILGRQATLLASEIVSVLKELEAGNGATFGEAMLAVRRRMLRKGYPMVLSITSYGDADWRLSGVVASGLRTTPKSKRAGA